MEHIDPRSAQGRVSTGLRIAMIVLLSVTSAACAELRSLDILSNGTGTEEGETAAAAIVEQAPGVAYDVSIDGVSKSDLLQLLEGASQLVALRDRPPAAATALERRANGDIDRLQTVLRSEGFYAAEVRTDIDRSGVPVQVTVAVSTGARYVLAGYDVRYTDSPPPEAAVQPSLEELGLSIGMPAQAPAIVAAQRALLDALASRGYPLAKVLDRKTLVDHGTKTMTVSLAVDAGPAARFGPVTVEGLSSVEENYVRGLIAWTQGDRYDRTQVDATRKAISSTGLFATVAVAPAPEVDTQGSLPITVTLVEGKQRSIGFGARYSTGEGFGGEVFWEHRNLLGRNERLRLTLTAAEIEQAVAADFRKPGFRRRDQDLLANLTLGNRNTDAFDEQSVSGSIGLERPWGANWRVSAGVSGEYSILADEAGEETFQLFGLPLTGARDTTSDPLNPSRGTRLALALTPYTGKGDNALLFGVATAVGSAYYAIDRDKRFVLAGRAKLGSIVGAETASVPANKRYYAGGGGSIRGYDFQSVGPLDEQNDPLGGRSILELNGEVRIRVTDRIGLVPFVDAGTVFNSPYPDFDETIRWAAGLGARYFTDFGPLRLDIAVPVNERNIDSALQFYISLGQAF